MTSALPPRLQSGIARTCLVVLLALAWGVAQSAGGEVPAAPSLKKIRAHGIELHYLEQGHGVPVVFVHGGLVDYRRWSDQVEPFARKYRVITYSRRYNFPNHNARIDLSYSAAVDAEDLAALIRKLRLGRVHVIGESYGAYAALILAVRHPDLVRTLVLAEAPMLPWLNSSPEGKVAYEEFMEHLWRPVGRAFEGGDRTKVLEIVVAYFLDGAKVDAIPAEAREMIQANLGEWHALAKSTNAFPSLLPQDVATSRVPTLLLEGEKTLPLNRMLDAQYATLLPNHRLVIVPNASHEMWDEQPAICREKTMEFLVR